MNKIVICHDINNKKYKVSANKLAFRPSIYGVLIEKGKVLLSKQWDGYDFPGGGMLIHETVEETLKREFWEETGLKIKNTGLVDIGSSFFYSIAKKQYWNCQMFYFKVKKISGKLSKTNLDNEEQKYCDLPEWIDIKKLNKIKFYNSLGNKKSIALIKRAIKYEK